jgi:uncharacterized protein (DUF488 family)
MDIFTVGHSTHTLEVLVALLRRHEIECLVDVRSVPRSRRMPHFSKEELERSLPEHGIEYRHAPELGGFRRPLPDSANTGWRVGGFRGYADYMETEGFGAALRRLETIASECRAAIMCAEGLWWRCHRRLISDALLARGWRVRHIEPGGELEDHRLTKFARVEGGRLAYPAAQGSLDLEG